MNRLRSSLEALLPIRGYRNSFKSGFRSLGSSFAGRTRCIREWFVPVVSALYNPNYIAQKQGGCHWGSFTLCRPFRDRQDLQIHIWHRLQLCVRLLQIGTRQAFAQVFYEFNGAETRSRWF